MRKVAPILVLRVALLVAVLACAVLVVEYQNAGDPAFCGAGSGCMAVRRSAYSHIVLNEYIDVPLPLLGLCLHAGLLALAVVARDKSQTFFVAVGAAGGGLVAIVLVALQAIKIGAFCKWCLLVDGSAVVAAVAAAVVHLNAARSPAYEAFLLALSQRRVQVIAWIGGAAVVGGLPFLWGEYPVVPPLPACGGRSPSRARSRSSPSPISERPFCRKLSPVLHEVTENWGDRVAVVRKMARPFRGSGGDAGRARSTWVRPGAPRKRLPRASTPRPRRCFTRAGVRSRRAGPRPRHARLRRLPRQPRSGRGGGRPRCSSRWRRTGCPTRTSARGWCRASTPKPCAGWSAQMMDGERPGLPIWAMLLTALAVAAASPGHGPGGAARRVAGRPRVLRVRPETAPGQIPC